MNELVIADYPEIKLILWDWNIPTISEEDMAQMIKLRAKYLYQDKLSATELELIEKLSNEYNDGYSLLSRA